MYANILAGCRYCCCCTYRKLVEECCRVHSPRQEKNTDPFRLRRPDWRGYGDKLPRFGSSRIGYERTTLIFLRKARMIATIL